MQTPFALILQRLARKLECPGTPRLSEQPATQSVITRFAIETARLYGKGVGRGF